MWSESQGWYDCSWHKRGPKANSTDMAMTNATMQAHWGQCVRDSGVWGTCKFANGSMGACNWTTDAVESRPKKWAHCEWNDNSTSKCYYKNETFGNCMGGGSQGMWGACKKSTGFWGMCQLNGTELTNCSWGDEARSVQVESPG